MLPCVCSVIDHRWRQNVVKTTRWHKSHRRVCYWCFTTFWCPLWSITEQTRGKVESICFIQWSEKNTDRYTYTLCTAWLFEDLCWSQTLRFVFASLFFFFNLLVNSFFEKFSTSSFVQGRIMAKTFFKTASLSSEISHHGNCCEVFLHAV